MPKASTTKTSFINPATLSFPSPDDMTPSPSPEPQPGPSRKRPRTEQSSEDRKEARAHRNRIAAQNSRDRRKAQFSFLERRVAELEEENRQLRAGMGIPLQAPSSVPVLMPSAPVAKSSSDEARERENEELKERIRTLEKGWDAVVKALAAQGLPTGITPSSNTDSVSPSPSVSAPVSSTSPTPSPSSTFSTSPSASLSHLSSTVASSSVESESPEAHQSTRHLAAGELALYDPYCDHSTGTSSLEAANGAQDAQPVDDATMESLFREIISERESSPVPQAHSELSSLPAESHSTRGLLSQDPLSQAVAAQMAAASEEEMTIGTLEGNRRMSVSGLSLGGLSGLSAAGVSETTGSTEVDGLGLGLSYNHLENDMMDLSDYNGDSMTSSESSAPWSDIGLTLEALLDILPTAQDVAGGASTNGLWESFEGRVALV